MVHWLTNVRSRGRALVRSGSSGFTLIELLIVIVILGVLAGVVVFAVGAFNDRGERAACQADFKAVEVAVEAYHAQTGSYPGGIDDLVPNYLRQAPSSSNCTIELDPDGTITATGAYEATTNGGASGGGGGGGEEEPGAPGAVTGLALQGAPTTNSATITWNAVDGATSYSIELTGGQGAGTFTDNAAPFAFSGLAANTNYTATVRAVNGAGPGAPATVSFTTAGLFSHTFDLSGATNSTCNATVQNVTNDSTYSSVKMPSGAPSGQYQVRVRFVSQNGAGLRFRIGTQTYDVAAQSNCTEVLVVASVNLAPNSSIEFRRNGGTGSSSSRVARVDYIKVTQVS